MRLSSMQPRMLPQQRQVLPHLALATTMRNATAPISTCVPIDGSVLCSWSANPDVRGTSNILWLCVSTLSLCVWNAVHPDVPYPGTPKWRATGKRIWWLFVGLFMPEMLVLTALGQFRQAYTLLVRVRRETQAPTTFPWWMEMIERIWPTPLLETNQSLTHRSPSTGSLELGYTTTSVRPRISRTSPSRTPTAPDNDAMTEQHHEALHNERTYPWTLTHSFYAVMHGFVDAHGDASWTPLEDQHGYVLAAFDPDKVLQQIGAAPSDPSGFPDLSVDDLNDRSKADFLAKTLLVWQFSVFVATCAARWNQNLPLSLIEITTVAHSLCSFIALLLWWYKPHSVGEATVIDGKHAPPGRQSPGNIFHRAFTKVLPVRSEQIDIPRTITIFGIAVLYGLPHLLGFSVHFQTTAEDICWKIATFAVIGSPVVVCGILWISRICLPDPSSRAEYGVDVTLVLLTMTLIILYSIASMFLVGESVRQIFALPEGSFHEPQLTRYLPSFS